VVKGPVRGGTGRGAAEHSYAHPPASRHARSEGAASDARN